MKKIPLVVWLAFALCVLAVGLPYWSIPYARVQLPVSLSGPGLVVVMASALLLRALGVSTLWTVTGIVGASVPGVVFLRILVETAQDPTRHNLWPFELILSTPVGIACALGGALLGGLLRKVGGK